MGAAAGLAAAGGVRAEGAASTPSPSSKALPAGDFEIVSRGGRDYGAALDALRAYALSELTQIGLPGMTFCVTDLEGFTATLALGWADRERRTPLTSGRLFQIGSISKSFIALTILALSDQGKIDLSAPASTYLPEAPWPETPVTVAQVLSHMAGLPDGAPIFPRTPDGRLWSGFAPGSRFSYSNTGFDLLGRIIERATDMPHQDAVDRFVRAKLGLTDMAGTISPRRRGDFAVGYWAKNQMAPSNPPGDPLEAAYWTPEDTPAGSIGATSGQMAVYLRALMRIARGEGAPVVSDAAGRRFATGVIAAPEFGPGARYACGVAVSPVDGAPALHHTGGMMSFSSSFHADPAAGVACFASVNARLGAYRPRRTTAYALELLRAVKAGAPLPKAPDALAPYRIKDSAPFVGTFVGPDSAFTLTAAPLGLMAMTAEGSTLAVPEGEGGSRLILGQSSLARYGLDTVRENGRVVGFWWGQTLFGRDKAPVQPAPAAALKPLAGAYLNRDPWVGLADIHSRGESLVLEGGGVLKDRGGYWSLDKDPGGVERLRFEGPLNGHATRLSASGADLLRLTT
jgi:CubicO group peptidase (beta-lactamase class C family)